MPLAPRILLASTVPRESAQRNTVSLTECHSILHISTGTFEADLE